MTDLPIKVSPEDYLKVQRLADKERRTRKAILSMAIENFIKNRGGR